ncbi:MAG: GGDEF domain-containing protein [Spirochaetaceae bacterium]|nr:GGDEF domain-containing protein [Spirochaetaceae bacterium]
MINDEGLRALEHVKKLLKDNAVPELSDDLAKIPLLVEIHTDFKAIRDVLYSFSTGDLSPDIRVRGIIPGCMKALQAHLRHLIWQVQMVEQGDFSQQVQFMGEFSQAFNSMVRQMDATLKELKQKEATLTALTNNLQNEVDLRNSVVEALQESESRFKYLASHDPLTGVLNRRSFLERAGAEVQIILARSISCCLAMLDIDHFKRFNDTYGHLAGDEALRHTVKVISSALRKNDFMGRYGGEEFVLFFSGADLETGIVIAERVRKSLAVSPVNLETGPVNITASFGVTLASPEKDPSDPKFIQKLINNADVALYEAKKAGRNRVVSFIDRQNSDVVVKNEGNELLSG